MLERLEVDVQRMQANLSRAIAGHQIADDVGIAAELCDAALARLRVSGESG
jgi:hypothetical protein